MVSGKGSTIAAAIVCAVLGFVAAGCGGGGNSPVVQPPSPPPPPITASGFFGINTNKLTDPWPAPMIPVASWRTLGSHIKWADINTGPGSYDFSAIDQWMARAEAAGQDVMYTVYATPSWASSRGINCISLDNPSGCLGAPNTSCGLVADNGPGICDPPDDLNCDGTGSNQHFKDFVTAMIGHYGPGKIKYWELWNEPNVTKEWNGAADCPNTPNASVLMLARMASDLKSIVSAADPNSKFTTPAPASGVTDVAKWMSDYLSNSNGATFADIIAFHGYIQEGGTCPSACPVPEKVLDLIGNLESVTSTFGQKSKPLFDTEGSWGEVAGVNTITDPDLQAAFTARYYLLHMGAGIAKLYWYGWDFTSSGYFFDPSTNQLNQAGVAYKQILAWTSGATVRPCALQTNVSTQWTCTIVNSNGTQSIVIWDTSQTCGGGTCTTTNATVGSQFLFYTDLAGNKHSISNGSVPIGLKPVLLTTS